ncbi:hypothetical protein Tco_0105786 [Tanacetum coccineum]
MKLEKALDDFDSHQEKRLSHLRTQLEQHQDNMIKKINLLWKTVSEKLNDAPVPKSVGDSMASENTASISHIEREELRRKGIKSPSNGAKEGETTTDITPEHGHNITKETKDEVNEVIDEEESEVETDEEIEEILEEEEEDEDGSFAYECDFMILEDTTSIIDRHLGEMAFGRPFIDETGLVYDREEGTVIFDEKKLGSS